MLRLPRSSISPADPSELDTNNLDAMLEAPDLIDFEEEEVSQFLINNPSSPPTAEELTNDNILRIIMLHSTDQETNELVWRCLGYRYDPETNEWDNTDVFPKWKDKYPTPPDLIGVRRIYTKEVDGPVLRANQALVRSIPMDYKNGIRQHLFGIDGFKGLKMEGLTPNKTRRAQCANWLLFYREALFGKSISQLKKERQDAASADLDVSGEKNLEARRAGQSARLASAPNEKEKDPESS